MPIDEVQERHELQIFATTPNPNELVTLGSGGSDFAMRRTSQDRSPSKRTLDTVKGLEHSKGNLNALGYKI